jgi:hypothetical protein
MPERPASVPRAVLEERRAALGAELLAAMRHVEQLRGAVALLDELLAPDAAGRPLEVVA